MSSLRNAIPRKAHKERAQPYLRRKFGLLEKHKDFVTRARAYHQKEQALQKIERLNGMLHSLDNQSSTKHVYYADNREEAREVHKKVSEQGKLSAFEDLPKVITRKRVQNANCVKMKWLVPLQDPCINGDRKGSVE